MNKKQRFDIAWWGLTGLLAFLAYREFLQINILAFVGSKNILESRRYIAFLAFSIASLLLWFGWLWMILKDKHIRMRHSCRFPSWLVWAFIGIMLLLPGSIKWLMPLPENIFIGFWIEILMMFGLTRLCAWLLPSNQNNPQSDLLNTAVFFMLTGAAHAIIYRLSQVTDYPFPLYWSEGNRFFDYSTLFGSYRYFVPDGKKIVAFISWGMQLPWAIPFLLPNLGICAFRLWNQLVWIIPTTFLGFYSLGSRPGSKIHWAIRLAFGFWVFLFLDQGPIYTPLVLAALLTLMAVRLKLIPAAVWIIIASFYANSSRWTWSYAPGIWAGMLCLLEISEPGFSKDGLRQLVKPLLLGVSGYFGGQVLPNIIRLITSPSPANITLLPNITASTTRQPLLWDRLLPNPTFPTGILLGLVWAVLPLLILLTWLIIQRIWKLNSLQQLGILGVFVAFLVAGIIASVKIGGGSNLHNLDMFLISLVLAASVVFRSIIKDIRSPGTLSIITLTLIAAALVTPATYTLQGGTRLQLPRQETTGEALTTVQSQVSKFSQRGEVLFIDHRQLLTFGIVQNIPLVDDYEKKYLMDQAMADNAAYFDRFYKDLKDRRFVLIVNEPANVIIRGSEFSFGEENDAFVKWVTLPLICAYEPIYTNRDVGLELLVPRDNPSEYAECAEIFEGEGD